METIAEFKQTSSLVRQFKRLVSTTMLLFLAGVAGVMLSSNSFLMGLNRVNAANDALDLHTKIMEGLRTSSRIAQRALTTKHTMDIAYSFAASQDVVRKKFGEILAMTGTYPDAQVDLRNAIKSMDQYQSAIGDVFRTPTEKERRAAMLVATQFEMEMNESLRKAQMILKKQSDDAFEVSYRKRHVPFLVALALTLVSLTYIVSIGYPLTRRFNDSILELLRATDTLSRGDFSARAKVLDPDEIGKLTHSFNQMVVSLKEHRDKLREAISARDEFLSIASHELKTPLTPLNLQLQLLTAQIERGKLSELPKERAMKMVDTLNKQIDRLETLIEDLLDVSRITSGRLKLTRERFNLSEAIEDVISRYKQQIAEAGCKLEAEIETAILANLDKLRVEQVLVNLLTNAIKYAPGKTIRIALEPFDGFFRLSVRDEGPGIAAEDQVRLFNRFERVKTRDNVSGLGLGLYICKQIVEAHSGRIWVESEPGHGAKFFVEMPLDLTRAPEDHRSAPPSPSAS